MPRSCWNGNGRVSEDFRGVNLRKADLRETGGHSRANMARTEPGRRGAPPVGARGVFGPDLSAGPYPVVVWEGIQWQLNMAHVPSP